MKTVLFKEVVPGQQFITVFRLENTTPIPIYKKLGSRVIRDFAFNAVLIKTGELLIIAEEEPTLIIE